MNTAPGMRTRSLKEQDPQATQSRKRQIDNDSDDEPLIKRARLTRNNLALFDKMGKKKASDPTDESRSTKTTSTTTSGFAIQALENGILPPRSSKPPKNLEDIRRRHAAPRDTASPPESVYNDYGDRVEGAGNEATLVIQTSGRMLKDYPKGYKSTFNRAFTNFPKDAGFNNGLSAPQPDFVEGLELKEYLPFPVHRQISGAVLYRDDPYSVTLPHLAGEWKGPDGSMREAELQSAYDGAAMVHARNQALAYMGKSDPPGHAEITTFTTDGINLNMYAHYATPSEEDKDVLEYHQYQYASTNVKDSYHGHKEGRRGLRNSQGYAKDQSYALRDQLKEHWKLQRSTFHPIAEEDPPPVPDDTFEETNADEEIVPYNESTPYEDNADEDNYEIVEQPCQPTPAASTESHSHASSKRSHTSSEGGRKRKALPPPHAPSRPRRSKAKAFWTLDDESGQYYHKHSDGTISWFDDNDDDGY